MPPPPPPPPDLADDAISEILLRLPPDEPQWLFRAALVCKPWLRTLSDPAFLRRYRGFHGAPPLLGLMDGDATEAAEDRPFVPTTAVPAFRLPESDDTPFAWLLDCRHGRVLASLCGDDSEYYLVYDPVTGDRHDVPPDPETRSSWALHSSAAVFCTAAGCDHLDCHGGPFGLVRVFTDYTRPISTMLAAMYSSEIGAWRDPVTLSDVPAAAYNRGTLIGDEIYYSLWEAFTTTIVKYDWANNLLSVVKPQAPAMCGGSTLMVMEDHSLGLAGIEDSRLRLWSRRVSLEGTVEWVQCRVIDLDKMMPMVNPSGFTSVVGFAEGVSVIFIKTGVGLFMMELKSGRVRKVNKPWDFSIVLPYMSFYTPGPIIKRCSP